MAEITREFNSIKELVPSAVEDLYKDLARKVKWSEEEAFQVRLMMEEAIANSVCHGNAYQTALKVYVTIQVDANKIKMSIRDEGKGFNHRSIADPVKNPEEPYKQSGRGIYLIKAYADDVAFNDKGNEIIITKSIGQTP